jgi:hypothetical protein
VKEIEKNVGERDKGREGGRVRESGRERERGRDGGIEIQIGIE